MGKKIYDWAVSPPWPEFLRKFTTCGRNVRDAFFLDIYGYALMLLVFTTALFCLFYYYYLNGRFGKYYKLGHYFGIMALNALVVGGLTFWVSESSLSAFFCPTGHLSFLLAATNAAYALMLFFAFSLIITKVLSLIGLKSAMGYKTPF